MAYLYGQYQKYRDNKAERAITPESLVQNEKKKNILYRMALINNNVFI